MASEKFYLGPETKKAVEDKQKAKRIRDKEINDIRWVLSDARGRRFLWRLLSIAGVFRTPYVPKDTNETFKLIGYKEIGLLLVDEITQADTDALLQMQREVVSVKKCGKE